MTFRIVARLTNRRIAGHPLRVPPGLLCNGSERNETSSQLIDCSLCCEPAHPRPFDGGAVSTGRTLWHVCQLVEGFL